MITILLVEDHEIVRQGVTHLLHQHRHFEVVAVAGDGREALDLLEEHHPDVLVIDLSLPGLDGLEVTRQTLKKQKSIKVVVLSMHNDEQLVRRALAHGAHGYVLKQGTVSELHQAIEAVVAGQRYLSQGLPETLMEEIQDGRSIAPTDRYESLTAREREVLHLVAEGYKSHEIGDRLFISHRTVETHRANLMAKLGLNNQTDLVRFALRRGLVPLTGDAWPQEKDTNEGT